MYRDSAAIYDVIYGYKDYRTEAEQLTAAIEARRPETRTLLDVACGSGLAIRFADAAGADAAGIDAAESLIEIARDRTPNAGRIGRRRT